MASHSYGICHFYGYTVSFVSGLIAFLQLIAPYYEPDLNLINRNLVNSMFRPALDCALSCRYQNNSDKAIAGVKGALTVYDIFDKEITVFRISNDQDIQPGKAVTWEGGRSLKYSMKSSDDKKFAYMDEGKYKVKWTPEVIIFKDGSSIKSQGD